MFQGTGWEDYFIANITGNTGLRLNIHLFFEKIWKLYKISNFSIYKQITKVVPRNFGSHFEFRRAWKFGKIFFGTIFLMKIM